MSHKYDNNTKFYANPQDLIGRKVRGFKFEDKTTPVYFTKNMEAYIGKVGQIIENHGGHVTVEFDDNTFVYPLSLIHEHIVEEGINVETPFTSYHQELFDYLVNELNVTALQSNLCEIESIVLKMQPSPQIIDLSNVEGVEMMVGNWSTNWRVKKVVAKISDKFMSNDGYIWLFAKPIEIKKVTMQEIEKKFGCRVEIVKED